MSEEDKIMIKHLNISDNFSMGVLVLEFFKNYFPHIENFYNCGVGPFPHNEAVEASSYWSQLQCYGFEPHPTVYEKRKETYPGDLYQLGIWGSPTEKTLKMTLDEGRSSFLQGGLEWNLRWPTNIVGEVVVKCVTLDSMDIKFSSPPQICLWADVEGSELEILKGATQLLESHRIKCILLEVTKHNQKWQPKYRRLREPFEKTLEEYLKKFGYVKFLEIDDCTMHKQICFTTFEEAKKIESKQKCSLLVLHNSRTKSSKIETFPLVFNSDMPTAAAYQEIINCLQEFR